MASSIAPWAPCALKSLWSVLSVVMSFSARKGSAKFHLTSIHVLISYNIGNSRLLDFCVFRFFFFSFFRACVYTFSTLSTLSTCVRPFHLFTLWWKYPHACERGGKSGKDRERWVSRWISVLIGSRGRSSCRCLVTGSGAVSINQGELRRRQKFWQTTEN